MKKRLGLVLVVAMLLGCAWRISAAAPPESCWEECVRMSHDCSRFPGGSGGCGEPWTYCIWDGLWPYPGEWNACGYISQASDACHAACGDLM